MGSLGRGGESAGTRRRGCRSPRPAARVLPLFSWLFSWLFSPQAQARAQAQAQAQVGGERSPQPV
jgi:hypothetical protein